MLIDAKANLNHTDNSKNTALHIAVIENNTEIAKMPIYADADLTIPTRYGMTALDYAHKEKLAEIMFLIEEKVKHKQ